MQDYKSNLSPHCFYQIYNRANGNEKLFASDDNYIYFLKQYNYYISPIAKTFAYCLMPNHFHFLVQIKAQKDLQGFKNLEGLSEQEIASFLSNQFSNLFNSYTKAYNKQNNRKGSLFIPRFNRKKITSTEYLKNTINYIHQNPISHEYVKELDEWKFSSYTAILSDKTTNIAKQEIIELFDNKSNFEYYHNLKKANIFALEMDLAY